MAIYTDLGTRVAEFDRLHSVTFRAAALSATGFTTGPPAFSRPCQIKPRGPWYGWKPNTRIGWISSRSFRPYNGRWEVRNVAR